MLPAVSLLLLLLGWGRVSAQEICVDQPEQIHVSEGENVALPCQFTYSKDLNPNLETKVSWRFSRGQTCNNYIYSQSSNSSNRSQGGRGPTIREAAGRQSAVLYIPQVTLADHDRYCCSVGIVTRQRMERVWKSGGGTELRVQDSSEFQVYQPDVLLPLEGDSVTISCSFSYPPELEPVLEVNVLWRAGEEDFCGEFIYNHMENFVLPFYADRISLVGDPRGEQSGSIRIDDLQALDSKKYCCRVQMWSRNGSLSVWQNRFGTRLQVGVFTGRVQMPGYFVTQPAEMSALLGESINLTCTFTYHGDHRETDPMWIGVYWRARHIWGDYLYHPNPELIHHLYKGRTHLIEAPGKKGITTLWVSDVSQQDSKTYFCLVAFRFCGERRIFVTETQQGTRLTVHEPYPEPEVTREPQPTTEGLHEKDPADVPFLHANGSKLGPVWTTAPRGLLNDPLLFQLVAIPVFQLFFRQWILG
ncbi:uncharacterized protein LOC115078731 [Rhinatrema bivittatum]|uniref:uncharacterized protein LOC115078731 n=1 Tax=Rhinatrema bivittatum TaxID=194408 RepID=UPI00112E4DAB|nr:uncharacterized protein LOC115078731 [Rhinatrema bivittatum]